MQKDGASLCFQHVLGQQLGVLKPWPHVQGRGARAMGDCVGSCWVPSAVPPSLPGALLAPCLHTRVSTGMVPELSLGWNLFGLAVTMSFGAVVVRRGSLGQPLIS